MTEAERIDKATAANVLESDTHRGVLEAVIILLERIGYDQTIKAIREWQRRENES